MSKQTEALERMAENERELGLDYMEPAQQQEPVAWRELCRRLYVELYWCDRQMMETLDADGEPMWTQGKTVRDVLVDAKAALDTSPQPAQQEPVAWRVRWPKMGGGYKWIMNDAPLMTEHGFINEPLYTSPQPAQQEPVAWHEKIKGMEVSMDVSTGEDDAHHRIYGRVYEVILEDGEGNPNAILAIEEDRNFTTSPTSKSWVGLTDEEIDKTHETQVWDARRSYARAIEAKLREKNA